MERLREMILRVSRSQAPVHIYGESGTGKELVARMIHDSGPRAEGPFVPVNCGAIPSELMESEFFGHKRGSFTGAVTDKMGLIPSAEGGTLFLDEVADLPLHMQVKLLRVIQEKTVRPDRRAARGADRRAHPVRHAQESRRSGGAGEVSRRPVLSHQRHRAARAAAARARRGHSRPRRCHRAAPVAPAGHGRADADARRHSRCCRISRFPATCASWKTCSNARWRSATRDVSTSATCNCARCRAPRTHHRRRRTRLRKCARRSRANHSSPRPRRARRSAISSKTWNAPPSSRRSKQARYNKTAAAKALGMTFRALRYRIKKLGIE